MTDARGRRHRRRSIGTGFGLALLLAGGSVSSTADVVRAEPVSPVTSPATGPVTIGSERLVPRVGVGQTPDQATDASPGASPRPVPANAGAARARQRAERARADAAVSQAIADRWASVPVPADRAAALALRARVLFDRHDAGDPEALDRYRAVRSRLAGIVAERVGVVPADLRSAWRDAPLGHQRALMAALSQIGVPYRSMASREWQGFDCSGLTSFAWAQAGVSIPRSSWAQIAAASSRSFDTAQAGDLVQYPGHVSMYLGVENAIVHSPYTGRDVEVDRLTRRSVRFGDPTA